jgi:hypothetical protein
VKNTTEVCVQGAKALPTAKTKDNCIKEGGTWVKMGAPKLPDDPLDKSKAAHRTDSAVRRTVTTQRSPAEFNGSSHSLVDIKLFNR